MQKLGQEMPDFRRVTPEELRRLALWRHYEAAQENGGLLVALARHRVTDREPLYELRARQSAQLLELLHDFSYHARKTLELAEAHRPGIVERAKVVQLLKHGPEADLGIEDPVPLTDQSLWWLLGRVIHSRAVTIHERHDVVVGSPWAAPPRTTSYWTLAVVGVQSDLDGPDATHCFYVEQLVEAFCLMHDAIREALEAARRYELPHAPTDLRGGKGEP